MAKKGEANFKAAEARPEVKANKSTVNTRKRVLWCISDILGS